MPRSWLGHRSGGPQRATCWVADPKQVTTCERPRSLEQPTIPPRSQRRLFLSESGELRVGSENECGVLHQALVTGSIDTHPS